MSESVTPPESAPVRVMLVDGEPIARLGLRQCLAGSSSFIICAEAGSVATAQALYVQQHPEVVVLDPMLDGGGGWTLLRELARAEPRVRCLVRLRRPEATAVPEALRAGAVGVILSEDSEEEFLWAMLMTALGTRHMSGQVTRLLGDAIAMRSMEPAWGGSVLSGRRAQVFRLLGEGLPPRLIAQRLGVAHKTVQTHIARLRGQLGARSQAELCRRAVLVGAGRQTVPPLFGEASPFAPA